MNRRSKHAAVVALLLSGLFLYTACDRGAPALDADDQVTLTISANPSQINNGTKIINDEGEVEIIPGESTITVNAIRADGRAVYDGTPISLITSGGSLAESSLKLMNGTISTTLTSTDKIEIIKITAQSGSVGTDGTVVTNINVIDGQIQLGNLTLVVSPTNLNITGGPVDVTLIVTDTTGLPIQGESVLFSTDRGEFDSRGTFRETNTNGLVQDVLNVSSAQAAPGIITVALQVRDQVITKEITVTENLSPIPVIIASKNEAEVGVEIFFDGSASNDPDGLIETYLWNFVDGEPSSDQISIGHQFDEPGLYKVFLRVTDDLGASQTATHEVTITPSDPNAPPVASFVFSPSEPRTHRITLFNAQASSDPDDDIINYNWDFGDGGSISGADKSVEYTYQTPGVFTVSLEVTDDNINPKSSVTLQEVVVTGNAKPTAVFTTRPLNPKPGDEVSFDASASTDIDGSVEHYQFDFGDDGSAGSTIPASRHTYAAAGSYEVFLTVTDNDGAVDFASGNVLVTENQSPTAAFTFSPEEAVVDSLVLFSASPSTSPDGTITSYQWSFGDGAQASIRDTTHSYDEPGVYQVQLAVFDNLNGTDQTVQLVTVVGTEAPTPALTISQLVANGNLLLDARATTDPSDSLDKLGFSIEGIAPDGVLMEIPNNNTPLQEVTVATDHSAVQVVFILTVKNSKGLESHVSAPFNYIKPPAEKK